MAKVNETGHAINVAHLQDLTTICTSYGTQYNPGKASISIAALDQLHTNARAALQGVSDNVATYNNVINARRQVFDGLKTLSTRIINYLQVTDATDATIHDAKGFNRKIQGARASKIPTTTPDPNGAAVPDSKTVSTSQQSFNQQVEHLNNLISLLTAEPSYTPNETELQVATLITLIDAMRTANLNVSVAYANISAARIARNEILYNPNTGVYAIAMEVKKYIKAIFGATSPQYKQVSSISFKETKI
jgi:hypothetical protein